MDIEQEQSVEEKQTTVETPETPVEAAPETPAAETPVVPEVKPPDPVAELERKLKASEREADRQRQRASYAMTQMDALARQQLAAAAKPPEPEPREETFPDQLSYAKAHSAWIAKQEVQTGIKEFQEQQQKTLADIQQDMAVREHLTKIAEIEQRDPTFAQAKAIVGQLIDNGNGQVAPYAMALYQELFDSPQYEGLIKHFAANPAEAQRLMALPQRQVTKEIAYLETQLRNGGLKPAPVAAAFRTTQAPPPAARPTGSQTAAAAIDLNDPNVPMDVWKKEHDRREMEKFKRQFARY